MRRVMHDDSYTILQSCINITPLVLDRLKKLFYHTIKDIITYTRSVIGCSFMKISKFLTVILALALALFWLTAAIALPILLRPFYYSQARALELDKATGFDYDTIFEAYDDVMDYLVYGDEFGTGKLGWSEEGKAHFADCKGLFRLDFVVLGLSSVFIIFALPLLRRKEETRAGTGKAAFYAASTVTLLLITLGIWAAADFGAFFTFFHKTLFPGKTNWIFNIITDPIVLILPYEFWMRAGALVLGVCIGGLWLTALLLRSGRKK